MKLNFTSSSKCHSYILTTRKTQNRMDETSPSTSNRHSDIFSILKTQCGMDETQLPFKLKVSLTHLLHLKTQYGINETQLSFKLKVSLIHLNPSENSKWNG